MKIGYFSSRFPYDDIHVKRVDYPFGGSVIATYQLILAMREYGHQISVFTTANNGKDSIETMKDMNIYRYSTNLRILSSSVSLKQFYKPFSKEVDIVHVSFDIPPHPLAGLRYARRKELPLVVTYHGDWDEEYGSPIRKIGVHFCNSIITKNILDRADVIISPSKSYIKKSNFLRNHQEKVVVVPNGVDLTQFEVNLSTQECRGLLNLPQDKKIVLFFGFLSPYKGPDILLKALPLIVKDIPNIFLVFAGDGILRKDLELLSEELNLKKYVRFCGFIDDVVIKSLYYHAADVYCLPSLMECFPITILESMASGTPVVASDIGGIPDIITDKKDGKLVEPNNSEELAKAIIWVLNNYSEIKFGYTGKEKMQKFSWKTIAAQTNEIYQQLVGV
jgi:glycosyltransferase involved in cell wall biosynthesis